MTDAREVLAEIQQRAEDATPGPWEADQDSPAAYAFVWAPESAYDISVRGQCRKVLLNRQTHQLIECPQVRGHQGSHGNDADWWS